MSETLTLYVDDQFLSPYAMSAFVALVEKKLPFDLRTISLDREENRDAAFRAVSLTGRVPTLVHGDFHLAESSAIAEYLDEVFADPAHPALYPAAVTDRAVARQLQAWLRSDLMPIRQERSTEAVFEETTLRAVAHWRFEPGTRGGTPVAFRLRLPVVFKVTD